MSTTPPEHGYSGIGRTPVTGAILPVPGNAELAVFLFVLVFLIVMWAADSIDGHLFAILMTVLTAFYISRRHRAFSSSNGTMGHVRCLPNVPYRAPCAADLHERASRGKS